MFHYLITHPSIGKCYSPVIKRTVVMLSYVFANTVSNGCGAHPMSYPEVLLGTHKLECECDRDCDHEPSVCIDWEEGTISILEGTAAAFTWKD